MPVLLANGTQVRQRQVDKSSSVRDDLSVPTLSYSSQRSLEDDLNYLRSVIKQIKGTGSYDSPLTASLEALYEELQEAVFYNATLTGAPTAPDPIGIDDYSNRVATTRFVADKIDESLVLGGDAKYVHVQNSTPSLVTTGDYAGLYMWYIQHNLKKYPSVTLVNSADQVSFGLVEYKDNTDTLSHDALRIYLTSPELGKAFLN